MIFVDPRNGDAKYDLLPKLRALGCAVESQQMDFGDVAFAGNGPSGATLSIGIEIKRSDLLTSLASGNLVNHQIPGLLASFDVALLLIEGRYRAGGGGILESGSESPWKDDKSMVLWREAGFGQRRWTYRELENRLNTLELKAGVRIKRTADLGETAAVIAAMHDWWTTAAWEDHTSHVPAAMKASLDGSAVRLVPPSLKERIAVQLPHLGASKASMAAGHFATVLSMMNAGTADWITLPGIGKRIASDIVKAIRGE